MSAICGIVGESAAGGRGRRDVALMLDLLAPRGPDGVIVHEDPGAPRPVVFGARRLAAADVPGQPVIGRGAHPGTFAVCDGSIFNREEVRGFIRAAGRTLRGSEDAERFAHLYELEGPAGLRRADAQFTLALWDGSRNGLVLARDPLGVRALDYRATPGAVLFASEIKALGPIAALVSGGNDSSANASIIARKIKEAGGNPAQLLHTFTVGLKQFEGEVKYNDLMYAKQVSDVIGSTHHESLMTNDEFLETIPVTIEAMDDLVSEPSSVFLHHALKLSKQQGMKVVVTGEANDELSCGHCEMISIREGYYRRWLPFSRLPGVVSVATSCGARPRARSTSGTTRSPGPCRRWAASCRPKGCGQPHRRVLSW